MKLLLDQNISKRLVPLLEINFPGSIHVVQLELETALDEKIWDYARENGFTILTQDSDFSERIALYGHPPKVIWLRLGNVSTRHVEEVLQREVELIRVFESDDAKGCLVIR
ncbi:MAG: DUF5615 family PIN-like protein [Patescibacteria group bacterium]